MTTNDTLIGIRPDGRTDEVRNGYQPIRDFIDNVIDFMRSGEGEHALGMYIDDEGMLMPEHELNLTASLLVQYPVYGNAVVCAADTDEEGNTLPPNYHIRKVVEGMASIVSTLYINAAIVGQNLRLHPSPETVPAPVVLTGDDMEAFLRKERPI